ncbi:LysR family transcriptional regulator [Streptomyces orinoci]|uniref:LysR family transcriptional regulator n=1 Tax=Streptomyces orinoci TaxID=67339 RepID=A0ABV3JYM4_STRON|nr:LysR family transcriptional regulator [Streptomyces orinoci]
MELRQLRYFCAVAEEANLTRAARRLRLSSPSLSQQIKALEREAGAPLFHRTQAGMTLTRAGRALLPEARAVLDAAGRALRTVRAAAAERPPLRALVAPGTPSDLLHRLYSAARTTGSALTLDVAATAGQLARIRRAEADLALVTLPADTEGLHTLVVLDEPLGVLLSAGHPLTAAARLSWSDLGGEELLWFSREFAPGYHDMVLAACHTGGWVPRLRIAPARRSIVQAELGGGERVVALRPESATAEGLVWRPLAEAPPRLRLALAWLPEPLAATIAILGRLGGQPPARVRKSPRTEPYCPATASSTGR